MKSLSISLLIATAIMSVQPIKAQTVDEVVSKYVDALGGKDKLSSLKTARMEGSINVSGTDVGVIVTKLQLVGQRNDISVMGQDGYQIYTPDKGWSFMPFMGQASPEALKDEEVKAGAAGLDLQGNLFNYKEKGTQVELLGKEKIDSAECYKVKATLKGGEIVTYFIDTKTNYIVKTVTTQNISGAIEVVNGYSNYKATDNGYILPFSYTMERGEIIYSKIEANVPVDEKIFTSN